ncbi:hypothetical protein MHU86_11232 [Fragilaria crotonensis]|nr:hypothetical protein MHU86_11232 [Fragilaria crotonensis]
MTTEEERRYLLGLVEERFGFICGHAHKIAYVLDPRYLGALMTRDERKAVEDKLIFEHCPSDHHESTKQSQEILCKEYLFYRTEMMAMRDSNDLVYRMIKEKKISVSAQRFEIPARWWLLMSPSACVDETAYLVPDKESIISPLRDETSATRIHRSSRTHGHYSIIRRRTLETYLSDCPDNLHWRRPPRLS